MTGIVVFVTTKSLQFSRLPVIGWKTSSWVKIFPLISNYNLILYTFDDHTLNRLACLGVEWSRLALFLKWDIDFYLYIYLWNICRTCKLILRRNCIWTALVYWSSTFSQHLIGLLEISFIEDKDLEADVCTVIYKHPWISTITNGSRTTGPLFIC